jgi:hypothetical protein
MTCSRPLSASHKPKARVQHQKKATQHKAPGAHGHGTSIALFLSRIKTHTLSDRRLAAQLGHTSTHTGEYQQLSANTQVNSTCHIRQNVPKDVYISNMSLNNRLCLAA